MTTDVSQWIELRTTMRRVTFTDAYPHPFLWVYTEGKEDPTLEFATQSGIAHASEPSRNEQIIPVTNTGRGPFTDRVMLGRSMNCDIIIRASSISKLHAVFHKTTAERALLADRDSKNGTTVNGESLAPGTEIAVVSGDELTFGLVTASFLSAGDLFDRL